MKRLIKLLVCIYYKICHINKCEIRLTNIIHKTVNFEGKNKIGNRNQIISSSFGFGSYCGDNNVLTYAKIGRFCSLGSDIRIVLSSHPSEVFVSTHPAFYSNKYNKFSYVKENRYKEILMYDQEYSVIIGNDVWIGDSVLIKGGIKIGNGAIVAMGSVVTKDVQPYSIVGGIPAKEIKKRFSEEENALLEKIKWWDKDSEWLQKNAELFSDIKKFINQCSVENL